MYFSVFQEEILGQNYQYGEDNHGGVSITINCNFSSPNKYMSISVSCQFFLHQNTLFFKLNNGQYKSTAQSTGNFDFVWEKKKKQEMVVQIQRCIQ